MMVTIGVLFLLTEQAPGNLSRVCRQSSLSVCGFLTCQHVYCCRRSRGVALREDTSQEYRTEKENRRCLSLFCTHPR